LHVEPELTDLFLAAVRGPVHIVFLVRVGKPPEHGGAKVAAAALRCLGAPPRRRQLVIWFEDNILPVVVLGVLCLFLYCIFSFACLQPR
jgi:hypothetical protein